MSRKEPTSVMTARMLSVAGKAFTGQVREGCQKEETRVGWLADPLQELSKGL